MKNTAFAALLATLTIGGCNAPAVQNNAVEVQNVAAPVATPSPAPAAGKFTRYIGKYPFDRVDGKRFQDLPEVHAAVAAAVHDPKIQRLILTDKDRPTTPIALEGGMLLSWGCEAHNCGPHNWTLLMKPDGSSPQVCYTDMDHGGTRWFANGAVLAKTDPCPSGDHVS
jgi:hypothetical protein